MPAGKIFERGRELQRPAQHVLRLDVVRDVDERRVGADAERDALHRARVVIARAEVGEQSDDRARHRLAAWLSSSGTFGAATACRRLRRGRLAEQHFAQVVLQEELLGDAERLEHPLDVAVQERTLLAAGGGIRTVLQRLSIDDDVFRVRRSVRRLRLHGAELRQQRAVRPEDANEVPGQRLGRRPIDVVEDVPAENAVDAPLLLREARLEERGQLLELALRDVAIDVLEEILDQDLAAKLLAEERDVGADDGAEIEEQRLRPRVQAGEKLGERLGRVRGRIAAVSGVRLVLAATGEEVG